MRFKAYSLAALVLGLIGFSTLPAQTQTSVRIPIILKNNGTAPDAGVDTVYIGLDPTATYGIDGALGEEENPPFGISGTFGARIVDIPGHTPMFGEGLKLDLRPYTGPTQKDTFRIKFQAGDGGYPVTISWSPNLKELAGKMTILGGTESADMLATNSFVISDDGVARVTIIREGDKAAGVEDEAIGSGTKLHLMGVSPNPVRASEGTHIDYSIGTPCNVTISLYDALGRLVATVLDERQSNPYHSIRLNTTGLGSGTYLYTIRAGSSMAAGSIVVFE